MPKKLIGGDRKVKGQAGPTAAPEKFFRHFGLAQPSGRG
jgi:hypothetical protein